MGMSAFYGSTDEAASLATIDRALEPGVTPLDTAEGYGPFINEQLLGKALAGRREQAVVATHTGIEFTDDGTLVGHNGRPEFLRRSLDRSLRHLGSDHVDLYCPHRFDPQVPVEETVGAMGAPIVLDLGEIDAREGDPHSDLARGRLRLQHACPAEGKLCRSADRGCLRRSLLR